MRAVSGSQWRRANTGVVCSRFLVIMTERASIDGLAGGASCTICCDGLVVSLCEEHSLLEFTADDNNILQTLDEFYAADFLLEALLLAHLNRSNITGHLPPFFFVLNYINSYFLRFGLKMPTSTHFLCCNLVQGGIISVSYYNIPQCAVCLGLKYHMIGDFWSTLPQVNSAPRQA